MAGSCEAKQPEVAYLSASHRRQVEIEERLVAAGRHSLEMQTFDDTRTSDLQNVLSFLKERYPLLSEAEIIKMALSNQYHRETQAGKGLSPDETPNENSKQAAKRAREHRRSADHSCRRC
jgi:hypothetical protein